MLVKNTFRKEIKEILLRYMVQGKIIPGVRISLPQLAEELEVSVTPIREALTQLTEIGAVTYIPNRGFFMTELSEKEAIDIFETIALLESEAVKKTTYPKAHLQALRTINNAFKKANDPLLKLEMDMKFHQKLIENYSNQYVQKIIEDIRVRIFIYEHQFMNVQPIDNSVELHDKLIQALDKDNIPKAVKVLQDNWSLSINNIIQVFQSNKK